MFPFKVPRHPKPELTRQQALALAPVKSRDVIEDETPTGFVRLSLPVAVRPALAGLARRFGLGDGRVLPRSLELDEMGSAVWRLIDGVRPAGDIAAGLAARYQLDTREAELAVAEFLRQLGRRGAIGVAARKDRGNETWEKDRGAAPDPAGRG